MQRLVVVLLLGALAGCEATEEDIERWKGTMRGPAKITAVVVESRYPLELRGRAAVALVEIAGWDHFNAAFERLSEEDRRGVIHAMIPRLREMYDAGVAAGAEGPTDAQVNAKDAMYDLYDWATPEDQAAMRESLIQWVTSDFNSHFLPGRRNIALIVEKVGAPATRAMAESLTPQNVLVAHKVAELIAEHGDEEAKRLASARLAKTASELGDGIRGDFWTAMSKVCGDPVRAYALEYAGRHKARVDEQVNALTCVIEGGPSECQPGCGQTSDLEAILAIAEDEGQDERVRAAAYDAARAKAGPGQVDRFLKMLDDPDVRYKATGVDIAVHLGKAKVIPTVLEHVGAQRERWAWQAKAQGQEYGFCNMGLGLLDQAEGAHDVALESLGSGDAYVRAGAANILGIVGTAEDVPQLERLASDSARIKGWEPDTVGAMVKQAIERLRAKDRPADVSARRGQACGL